MKRCCIRRFLATSCLRIRSYPPAPPHLILQGTRSANVRGSRSILNLGGRGALLVSWVESGAGFCSSTVPYTLSCPCAIITTAAHDVCISRSCCLWGSLVIFATTSYTPYCRCAIITTDADDVSIARGYSFHLSSVAHVLHYSVAMLTAAAAIARRAQPPSARSKVRNS